VKEAEWATLLELGAHSGCCFIVYVKLAAFIVAGGDMRPFLPL
jgi:hypothetical protein